MWCMGFLAGTPMRITATRTAMLLTAKLFAGELRYLLDTMRPRYFKNSRILLGLDCGTQQENLVYGLHRLRIWYSAT